MRKCSFLLSKLFFVYLFHLMSQRIWLRKQKGGDLFGEAFENYVTNSEQPTKMVLQIAKSEFESSPNIEFPVNPQSRH